MYEPPKQLYRRGIVGGLFRTLLQISKRNGNDYKMEDLQLKTSFEGYDFSADTLRFETRTTFTEKLILAGMNFKLIFCSKMCIKLIAYSILGGSTYIIFFGVTYNASKIGLASLQYNVMLLAGVEAVCYALSIIVVSTLRRRMGSGIMFSIILVGCGL